MYIFGIESVFYLDYTSGSSAILKALDAPVNPSLPSFLSIFTDDLGPWDTPELEEWKSLITH